MVHESHRWVPGSPPPELRPHSAAKHRVIGEYIKRYIATLTKRINIPKFHLSIVDGFAGGNAYLHWQTKGEVPGSPGILLDSVHEAEQIARASRTKPFDFRTNFYFVEKEAGAYHFLRNSIKDGKHRQRLDNDVILLQSDFNEEYPKIVDSIAACGRMTKSIFVLDQFGYAEVLFASIREILQKLPKSEVILTFASDALFNYISTEQKFNKHLHKLNLSLPLKESDSPEKYNAWRRLAQVTLHKQIKNLTGATFYTPFFIKCKESHRSFWLLHLSSHYKARDVMVSLHWDLNNNFCHHGKPGLDMLGYDTEQDLGLDSQLWVPSFYFDDTARDLTLKALYSDIPRYLHTHKKDETNFQEIFAGISNDMPASGSILKEALAFLAAEGVISVKDDQGLVKRKRGIQSEKYIIILNKQKFFSFFDL